MSNNAPSCKLPGCNNECWSENGIYFDFCTKFHAKQFKQKYGSQTNNVPKCKYPNCNKDCWLENGEFFDFCGKKHAKLYRLNYPNLSNTDSYVEFLDQSDPNYSSLVNQFTDKWLHTNTSVGNVEQILKISISSTIFSKYSQYQDEVHNNIGDGGVYGYGGRGNEQRRFHGPNSMKCNLGLQNNTTLCNDNSCAVCGIIRQGFLKSKISRHKFQRFGPGFYFTSTSSKSNDYNGGTNTGLGGNYKAMFVCKVICGKVKKLYEDETSLTQAPNGFDSVVGEVGQDLNYDEVVIYKEEGCIPSYLIIYS